MRIRAWRATGWLLAALVVVGLALRWTEILHPLVIGATALTPWLIVPLAGLVVVGRLGERKVGPLRLTGLLLTVVYLVTFVSPRSVIGCGPSEGGADAIVIHTHNIRLGNSDPARIAAGALEADADVIVLQEVWGDYLQRLADEPGLSAYRHRAQEPSLGISGLAIWSRLPIESSGMNQLVNVPVLQASIEGPTGPFDLHAIHTTAPITEFQAGSWRAQFLALESYDNRAPSMLVGDFNATMDHRRFRSLLDRGWTDAHEPKGCGLDATWPTGRSRLALLRLDHVLVSDHFEVLALDVGQGGGSDHRSVTATVRLRSDLSSSG